MQNVLPGPSLNYWIITLVFLSVVTIVVLVNVPHFSWLLEKVGGWQDKLLVRLKNLGRGDSDQIEIGGELEENDENGNDDGIELEEQHHGFHNMRSELSLV
jgi:hypothetical protein